MLNRQAFSWGRVSRLSAGVADQGFSVGAMFLVNVALARAQSRQDYGVFTLSYSLFTFIAGLHNAALLEAYTVYGSGRYRAYGTDYAWLIWRTNTFLALALTALGLGAWGILRWRVPGLASPALLGMACSGGILLSGALVRRTLYVQGLPRQAVRLSATFLGSVVVLLGLALYTRHLNGFSGFIILAFSWLVSIFFMRRSLPRKAILSDFERSYPQHWSEHWKYARWVLATAFVFQLTTQAYYWIAAQTLSLQDVAALRVMYIIVTPMDQIFVALTLLVLPGLAAHYAAQRFGPWSASWKAYAALNTMISIAFAFILLAAGRPLMHAVYGGKFDDVSGLLKVFVWVPVVMSLGGAANAALKSIERPHFVFFAYLAGGVCTFTLGIALVRQFSLAGAIYGMLASSAVYTLTMCLGLLSLGRPHLWALRAA